jgi:hypothetical protein
MGAAQSNGIILVWDLDQTLVGTYEKWIPKKESRFNYLNRYIELNNKAMFFFKKATEKRKTGEVIANFLLTNNSDTNFIERVKKNIEKQYSIEKPFDLILNASEPSKRDYEPSASNMIFNLSEILPNSALKSLNDVRKMMTEIGYNLDDIHDDELGKRVYFFDDNEHILSSQSNFIKIEPAFLTNALEDETNYSLIESFLSKSPSPVKGGGGGNKKKTKRKTNKKRRSKSRNVFHATKKNTRIV